MATGMRLLRTYGRTAKAAAALIATIEARGAVNTAKVETVVRTHPRRRPPGRGRGRQGVRRTRFDGLKLAGQPLRVAPAELEQAWKSIPPALQLAMRVAQANIRAFAQQQKPEEWVVELEGLTTGQIVRPLSSVACYVPGGRYPYPSTVLMTATPAKVAGVERVVVCSPKPAPETLAAAHLAGVSEFYRIGGAQAVAAVAFGTETIPRVEKIVGPGNLYVTAAKQMVSHECRRRHARRPHRDWRDLANPANPQASPPTSSRRPSTTPNPSPSSSPPRKTSPPPSSPRSKPSPSQTRSPSSRSPPTAPSS